MKPYHATHTCDQTSQEADRARALEADVAYLRENGPGWLQDQYAALQKENDALKAELESVWKKVHDGLSREERLNEIVADYKGTSWWQVEERALKAEARVAELERERDRWHVLYHDNHTQHPDCGLCEEVRRALYSDVKKEAPRP